MLTDIKIISKYQPSLNQCLISKKYYSQALPELSHLSLPPGFNVNNYPTILNKETITSSTLSEKLFKQLISNIDPNASIKITKNKFENSEKSKETKKKSKKNSVKSNKKSKKKR